MFLALTLFFEGINSNLTLQMLVKLSTKDILENYAQILI